MTTPEAPSDEPVAAAEDRVARARMRRASAADEVDIAPKLPRGSGFKISKAHLFKITLTGALLVFLIVIQRPCADAVSKFVTSFDEPASEKAKMPKPGTVDSRPQYEIIRGDMTEAEMKAAVERARARAGATGSQGSGSASTGSDSVKSGSDAR